MTTLLLSGALISVLGTAYGVNKHIIDSMPALKIKSDNKKQLDNIMRIRSAEAIRIADILTEQRTTYKEYIRLLAIESNIINERFGAIEHASADTKLYYLELRDGTFKVGVTRNTVSQRYKGITGYNVLYCKRLVNALNVEKAIKQYYSGYVTNIDVVLGTAGTEIFTHDILKMKGYQCDN